MCVCASYLSCFIFAMLLHSLKHTHCLQNFPFRPVPAKDRQRFYKLELEYVWTCVKSTKTMSHMGRHKQIRNSRGALTVHPTVLRQSARIVFILTKMIYIHLDMSENPATGLQPFAFPSFVISITTLTRLNKTPRLAWCQQAGILSDLISMSLQKHPRTHLQCTSPLTTTAGHFE